MYGSDELIRRATILYQVRGEADAVRSANTINSALGKMSTTVLTVGRSYDALQRQLDPAIRAQERHAKAVRTTQAALNEGIITLNQYNRTLGQIDQKFGSFGRGADIAAYGKAMDDVRAKFNPLFNAGRQYKAELEEIRDALKKGAISQREFDTAIQRSKANFANSVSEIKGERIAALGKMPENRLRQHQVANLSYQMNDVISGLAMGQSPGMVAMQQGGQIYQILAEGGGGMGAGVKRLGNYLSGLITPLRVATAGFVGMGIAAVAAFNSAERRIIAMTQALNGVGAASGLSPAQLARLAENNSGGLSYGAAHTTAAGFAGAGMSPGQIAALTASTRGFGKAFGIDNEEAAKELTSAFADPVRGVDALNKRFGTLDAATARQIELQRKSGDLEGARNTLLQAYLRALESTTRQTSTFGGLMEKIGVGISFWLSKFGKALSGPTEQERLQAQLLRQQEQLRNATADTPAGRDYRRQFPGGVQSIIDALNKTNTALNKLDPRIKQLEVDRTRNAGLATETIRKFAPELFPLDDLYAQRKQLELASSDPETAKKFGATADQAKTALDRLDTAIRNFKTPLERLKEDGDLAVASALALSLQQRALAEAERARVETLRQTNDLTQAAQAAENAKNRAIAEGVRQAREANRDANRQLILSRLLPGERDKMQLQFRMEDLRRNTEVGGGNVPPMFVPFKSGLDVATAALSRFTGALGGKSGGGAGADLNGLFGGGAKTANGLNATFAGLIGQLQSQFPFLRMTSGHRSTEEQAALFAKYGPGKAARPGTSRHEAGLAADFSGRGMSASQRAAVIAAARGMGLEVIPSNHGALHIQGPRSMAAGGRVGANDNRSLAGAAKAANDNTQSALLQARQEQAYTDLVRQNMQVLDQRNKLMDKQFATFGMTTAQMEEAAKKQELLNEVQTRGVALTPQLAAGIDRVAAAAGQLAARAESFERLKQALGQLESLSSSFFSGFLTDIANGKKGAEALRNALRNLGLQLIQMAAQSFAKQLFGSSGGIFSKLIGGLFGGGGGSTFGAVGSAGWFYANGGVMSSRGDVPLRRYAAGGVATSPQIAMFGEGSSNEAYVPLPDGRRIPAVVEMRGGGGGASTTVVSPNYGGIVINGGGGDPNEIAKKVNEALQEHDSQLLRNWNSMQSKHNRRYA